MKRTLLFIALLVVVAPLSGQDVDLPPGKWWEDPRLAERLALSEEQQATIRDIVYEHARRMIDLKADVEMAGLDLATVVNTEEFDEPAVRSSYTAFQTARRELENERFEMLVAVRRVLTAEQWSTLQELRRRAPQGRQSPDGGGRRHGRLCHTEKYSGEVSGD